MGQEADLALCLREHFSFFQLGVGFDLSLLANGTATASRCESFEQYRNCTEAAMEAGGGQCQSYLDRLLKDMMGAVCSEDGRAALEESQDCLMSEDYQAQMEICAGGFVGLDFSDLSDLAAVCRELRNLSQCAVTTSEEMCGSSLAGLVGEVLNRTMQAHFEHGCELPFPTNTEHDVAEKGPGTECSLSLAFWFGVVASRDFEIIMLDPRRLHRGFSYHPPVVHQQQLKLPILQISIT